MDHGGHSEMEGEVMSQVQEVRDDLCDNLTTTEPLTAQTGNLNETSTLSQSLSLLQKGESGEQGLFQNAPLTNTCRSWDEEKEKEGDAKGNRDDEEEDLDQVMKEEDEEEEEEDISEGSSSIICCQSPDTPMTDSSYSETASLLETPYPFSPGTSPEPTSPLVPTATPETPFPISQASQSQSVVSVKPLASNTESFSSRMGSVPGVASLTTWPADPSSMTSHCSSPCPPKHTCITEHSTSSTQSARELFTSSAAAFTVMADTAKLSASVGCTPESAATGPSVPLSLDSTSATTQCSSSRGAPGDISGPMCDMGHAPDHDLLKSLEVLAQRGDDAHLPQYLHQIAEAFVLKGNFEWALWCIQLERLYHQRVLDNLNALQEQWVSHNKPTSSELAPQHLDSLKHICQTHSRPRAKDAACASLDILRSAAEEGGELSPRVIDDQVVERMEARDEDSSHSESSHPIVTSCEIADEPPGITKMKQKDPEIDIVGREGFHRSQLTDRGGGEAGEAVGRTISVLRDELHPSTSVALEQPDPAEQQGGDLCLTQDRQAKKEAAEHREQRAVSALKMDVGGEDDEEEKLRQRALQVETIVIGTEVEQDTPLHPEALAEKSQLQESPESFVQQETSLPHDDHMKQQEQEDLDEEEYELEDADIIREASSLDDLAKLITVEEISPVSGLVSILKRRSETVDRESAPKNTVTRSSKASTKRRVRFKFPDDSYDQDVGGGDSCLLLFLLCLVTVVISLGGTALYCALGDVHSSVCQDFSRNADFYMNQIQRGISHIQHWFGPGS